MHDKLIVEPVTSSGAGCASLASLLDAWQETADPDRLAALVAAVRPVVEAVAGRVLRSRRIADLSAVDDVVSLVLDHLRRLPPGLEAEQPVAMFRGAGPGIDRGGAYIRLLARNRSLDIARSRRRDRRHVLPFSAAGDEVWQVLTGRGMATPHRAEVEAHDRLAAAIDRLDPELRSVVEMLLDGKSQAVIAHVLDVCEGTVSRLRSRAVAKLRTLMEE